MGRILGQMTDIDALRHQGLGHKAAKRIGADPADKGRIATKPCHPDRHIGGRTARTLEVVHLPFRDKIHHRIPHYPHTIRHLATPLLHRICQSRALFSWSALSAKPF
ncbi:hypothetical protein D3C75_1012600 [compost metagenome]